jgi:hypothetical protein
VSFGGGFGASEVEAWTWGGTVSSKHHGGTVDRRAVAPASSNPLW